MTPTILLHSKKESAYWAVDVTAQMYACWLSIWTAFIWPCRLYIYFWPIKTNENVGLMKFTGVEWIITADGISLLLSRTYAPQ